jgi:hypothetical protein
VRPNPLKGSRNLSSVLVDIDAVTDERATQCIDKIQALCDLVPQVRLLMARMLLAFSARMLLAFSKGMEVAPIF